MSRFSRALNYHIHAFTQLLVKLDSLHVVAKCVTKCTKCDLHKTRKMAVAGKGAQNANIVLVGEAPGKNEDEKGEPFVGIAGQILDKALVSAGVSRDDVYITNIVKCRPPQNRVPTMSEREACANYLEAELELVKPKIVCIMGNTAYASILGGSSITQNRGKIIIKNGTKYFLCIHPAAVIYNRSLKDVFTNDIKTLVNLGCAS